MWTYIDDIAPKDFANGSKVSYDNDTLDLRDIVLLLNYERATTDPRFRYTKLLEVATPGCDFKEVAPLTRQILEWRKATVPRTGVALLRKRPLPEGALEPRWVEAIRVTGSNAGQLYTMGSPHPPTAEDEDKPPVSEAANESSVSESADEPDTPDNMLPIPTPPDLQEITPKALETYYWQARNCDSCFHTALIFQHFIDLFSREATKIRVRTVHRIDGGKEYITFAGSRSIVEMNLSGSKAITACIILDPSQHPGARMCLNDWDPSATHVVLGFSESSVYGEVDTILDMASLQFGDVGRGDKGRSLFVLEPKERYVSRLAKFAYRNNFATAKRNYRLSEDVSNNDWFLDIARRAKDRWDNRATTPWCGHCGAPPRGGKELQRCFTCKAAYFCNTEHQYAAWKHHKHFCKTPKTSLSAGSG